MDIRPILSTLRRHKTAAALIVLEVALSCAIICNAVFLISTRLQRMDRPTGMADSEIVRINIAGIGDDEISGGAGSDVMTGPLSAILALAKHPLTDNGLAQFLADHAKGNKSPQ